MVSHHAAGVQQAVGENMAAVGVGAKLDFVHRDELDAAVQRHCLDRAGEVAGAWGDDFFLASDQSDILHALAEHHAVIVFAGQETQRKTDDAGGVAKQTLDRQVSLAGVGRPEHCLHSRRESGHALIVVVFGAVCKHDS